MTTRPKNGFEWLRPLEPPDEQILWVRTQEQGDIQTFRLRGTTPPLEQFHAELWGGVLAQFAVRSPASASSPDSPLGGVAAAYEYRPVDGHCKVSFYLLPEFRNLPGPQAAFVEFVDHLFSAFTMRKIYLHVNELNLVPFSSLQQHMKLEGVLKSHSWIQGAYRDENIYSLDAAEWTNAKKSLVGRALSISRSSADALSETAIAEVVAGVLQVPVQSIDFDAELVDLGMDSLDSLELAVCLEDLYGVPMVTTVTSTTTTVRILASAIAAANG